MSTFCTTNPVQPSRTFKPKWKEIGATAVVTSLAALYTLWTLYTATGV